MEEVKGPSKEREASPSSSSSSLDMRDWDLLDPDIVGSKKSGMLIDITESEPETIMSPSGLFMHESPPVHSGVEDLVPDNEHVRDNQSNSSSDIDVIDECLEDSHGSLSIQSMDISFCPSEISTTVSASPKESPEESATDSETPMAPPPPPPESSRRPNSYFENFLAVSRLVIDGVNAFRREERSMKEYLVFGFFISVCLVLPCSHIAMRRSSIHEDKVAEMEGHINKLESENAHLKNKVLYKIENGRLFGELDEEVRDLKVENLKLHKAMQGVIHQLEEQTHAIRRGIETKEHHDIYKNEIAKLKEQINMLRIDNEDLQTQLVRIRYGKHNNRQEDYGGEQKQGFKPTPETPERLREKSPFQGTPKMEEIGDFRKKLNDEFAKLKNWGVMLEDFAKEIHEPQGGEDSAKKHFGQDKHHGGWENDKPKYKNKKNKRFYNWSWKEIKKNFKGTLENFPDVSDMISKYVLIDRQKVDGVLSSIGHYFKKAQDKTQKILESYSVDEKTQAVKDDIWTLMGEMKNKWADMKNDFLKTHFGGADSEENEKSESHHDDETYREELGFHQENEQAASDEVEDLDGNAEFGSTDPIDFQDVESEASDQPPAENASKDELVDVIPEVNLRFPDDMGEMDEFRQLLKEAESLIYARESNLDTWMFERARHRAELRKVDGEGENGKDLNWYLRKGKSATDSDKDSF